MAIKHGKVEFSKIKKSISNIPMQAANICNVLQRPEVSNWPTVVKLIQDLKYRGEVYFESVLPHTKRLLIWNFIISYMKVFLLQRMSQGKTCSGSAKHSQIFNKWSSSYFWDKFN